MGVAPRRIQVSLTSLHERTTNDARSSSDTTDTHATSTRATLVGQQMAPRLAARNCNAVVRWTCAWAVGPQTLLKLVFLSLASLAASGATLATSCMNPWKLKPMAPQEKVVR